MKILFFVSGTVKSNFSYRPLALARALRKHGHDVSIVAPKADKYNNFTLEAIADIDGVHILQPFQFATRRLEINLIPYLVGAARIAFRKRPDLIYIYKPTPISAIGLLGKLFHTTTVVADFDDLGSEVMKIEGHPLHQRKLVEWSERAAARYADRLIVASRFLLEHYGREFPGTPIHLMPNGVDEEWFSAPIIPTEQKKIVFMGSLNRKSILEPLFEALPDILKKIPDAKVLIMGDGKFLPYFKERCSALEIGHAVTFTGWLDIAAARANLHEGDIGYSYMPRERTVLAASNMKISQYMSRGAIPLVSDANDLSGTADFKGAAYIAKADDLMALVNIVTSALYDTGSADKAKNARLFARKHFNWDTLAAGFEQWVADTSPNT